MEFGKFEPAAIAYPNQPDPRADPAISFEFALILADNASMDDQESANEVNEAPDESSEQRVDLASLERDIDNLMSNARSERGPSDDGGGSNQVDLLLKEINELLSHETNSLLTATNGLLGKALESIFDPKVLANKNQKIDKALVQALAKGKAGAAAGPIKAPVTNPAPRFAGISRPMTADLSKTGIKPAAAPKLASGPRAPLERPEEEAPGAIKFGEAPKGDTGAFTTRIEEKPPEPDPVVTIEEAAPTEERPAPEPEPVVEKAKAEAAAPAPAPAPEPAPKAAEKPKAEAPKEREAAPAAATAEVPDFPQPLILKILALPMRLVPESSRLVVSAVALTMLFSAPVAWVLAHRAVTTQGIGPIDFSQVAAEQAEAEEAAKAAADSKAAADKAAEHGDSKGDSKGEASKGGGGH
ncbi:MAG: hypothetical protein RLY21_2535 [Planctomycetota bacterium]